jgi:farnesyl-diphosphate farnesyltransferase
LSSFLNFCYTPQCLLRLHLSLVMTESPFQRELGGQLLASVSRSFYLTLKALPLELREPISLAYLLARTADTLADTAQVSAADRLQCLEHFSQLLHEPDAAQEAALAGILHSRFMPLQEDAAEQRLMEKFSSGLAWLRSTQGAAHAAILKVLGTIISGQRLDIQRFPDSAQLRSLQHRGELEDYTYLVAGCVGEFWTELCLSELSGAFTAERQGDELILQGIRFGKGLQLINILRDLGKDARMGRCYLPEEDWKQLGLTAEQIQHHPTLLRPLWQQQLVEAEQCMIHAEQYVQQICHKTLRYATALPWLLGVRTLKQLKQASDAELLAGVKISRTDVAAVLAQTAWNNSPAGLAKLAAKWSI